jgi:hypothetical protein
MRRNRWRWILPIVFVLITALLLSLAPSHHRCQEIARGSDGCLSLPELIASLINGPALCRDCALQLEYFPGKYSSRLAGVLVMWFWIGWLLDEHRRRAESVGSHPKWIHSCSYLPAILFCAVRIYQTFRHDRVDMTYVIRSVRQSGPVDALQAAGRIWVERALVGWLLLLLVFFVKELKSRNDAQSGVPRRNTQTPESPPE